MRHQTCPVADVGASIGRRRRSISRHLLAWASVETQISRTRQGFFLFNSVSDLNPVEKGGLMPELRRNWCVVPSVWFLSWVLQRRRLFPIVLKIPFCTRLLRRFSNKKTSSFPVVDCWFLFFKPSVKTCLGSRYLLSTMPLRKFDWSWDSGGVGVGARFN